MPSTGLLPFLRSIWRKMMNINQKFQCPQPGFFHFYCFNSNRHCNRLLVSMPSTGLLPFLLCIQNARRKNHEEFQCPQPGFFHFYFHTLNHGHYGYKDCFNALNRASSISTWRKSCILTGKWSSFQCPQPGFFHFYVLMTRMIFSSLKKFQCPQPGFFHFYKLKTS